MLKSDFQCPTLLNIGEQQMHDLNLMQLLCVWECITPQHLLWNDDWKTIYISSLYIETMAFKELFVMYYIMVVNIKL